jgi:uncharacterized protein (DUF1684 family)
MIKVITFHICFCSFVFSGVVYGQFEVSAKQFQEEFNASFLDTATTILSDEDLLEFDSIPFFEIDVQFIVTAKLKFPKKTESVEFPTTTDRMAKYNVYAVAHFRIKGKKYKLNLYYNPLQKNPLYVNHLFVPFTDLTNGEESYGGGRFIDATKTGEKKLIIDFNKAYNPYCAYSLGYSCPIPPEDNHLDVKIEAGVMYDGH